MVVAVGSIRTKPLYYDNTVLFFFHVSMVTLIANAQVH